MKKIASFTFKYLVQGYGKDYKGRKEVDLNKVSASGYQCITYTYKGNEIIDIDRSEITCYLKAKEIFFKSITEESIRNHIMEVY